MSRLTILHINIIGFVVVAIVAAGLYFTLITGANEAIATAQKEYQGVKDRADKYDTAKRALADAQAEQQRAIAQYSVYQRQYMPVLGYTSDRMTTMMKVFWPNNGKSWPERFIRIVRAHMARQAKLNKIVWENPGVLQLGPFGPDPNTIQAGMAGEGLGDQGYLHYSFPMTVRARNLAAVMKHLREWPTIRGVGVPVIEGFTLTGNTPDLVANYTVTFTVIVDQDKIPPADNRVGGQMAGGGGGGGIPGPGGYPGPGGMTAPPMSGGPGGPRGPMGAPTGPMSGGGMTAPPMSGAGAGMPTAPMSGMGMGGPRGPMRGGMTGAGGGGGGRSMSAGQ